MIAALVVVGAAGAGVALMSPSALRGKVEQEAGMRAYYNANSGLQFIQSINNTAQSSNINFTDFTNLMGGGTVMTYGMPHNGTFSYQLGNILPNGVNGTYQIINLNGTVRDDKNNDVYLSVLYGGGRGRGQVVNYTIHPSGGNLWNYVNYSKKDIDLSGSTKVIGDVSANMITFGGGTVVEGSVKTSSKTQTLKIVGASIGGEGKVVCSNSNIDIGYAGIINGNIYSKGYVKVSDGGYFKGDVYAKTNVEISGSGYFEGTIYAGGDVKLSGGAHIKGDVYAGGDVVISNGTEIDGNIHAGGSVIINVGGITKNVYAGGSVYLNNSSTYINGNVYTHGTVVCVSENVVKGTIDDIYAMEGKICSFAREGHSVEYDPSVDPVSYVFGCDYDDALPDHEVKSATEAFSIPWGGTYNGKRTITARSSLDDYYSYTAFDVGGGTSLCLDLSNGGYITIFVSGTVNIQGNIYVKTTSGDCFIDENRVDSISETFYAYASKVYMDSSGSQTVTFGGATPWFGTLFAEGSVQLASGSKGYIGAIYSTNGNIINSGGNAGKYVEADYVKQRW